LKDYFGSGKKFFLTEFYIHQRKRRKVLLEDGQPLGGKWTYDTENRKKMPASVKVPDLPVIIADNFSKNILKEVRQQFPDNPGSIEEFIYPTDHATAEKWLDVFFQKKIQPVRRLSGCNCTRSDFSFSQYSDTHAKFRVVGSRFHY